MTLKILKQTLLDRWKSIGLVTALFLLFMTYYSSVYPSTLAIDLSSNGMNDLLNSPAIQLLLGKIHVDNSFESFLSIKALVFISWISCGFAAWMAAQFLSGEIDHKTIDLLLAQPVQRGRLVLARFGALAVTTVLIMAAALAGTIIGVKALDIETSIPWLAYTMVYMGMLTLAFGAIALFISAVMSDGRRAALVSLGIMILMYLMETAGSIVDLLGPLRYLSIFHYARYNEILMTRTLSVIDFGVMLAVAVVFVALAACVFRRRDINVA
jgi:ABC-2 type transport system permease protein